MGEISDFDDYLKLEDRLFKALREKVYKPSAAKGSDFDRYRTGSRSDPLGFSVNWNRTFELPVDSPRGGVLMLHGLTDSPYSVRSLAQKFQAQGFWVVGLRLPGHGTIPAELLDIHWEDWAAAVRMGARHVADRIGSKLPFYLMGYSTGAPLAVEYALSAIDGENIPGTNGLILLSPAMGLQPIARLAKFQLGLSRLPGLGKMAWESISPEYDPYKYNSFPVNAGEQVYRLAMHVQERIKKMASANRLASFPRVIAFQSIVDATIQADAVADKFLTYLPSEKNTLVVFDVNQQIMAQGVMKKDAGKRFKASLLEQQTLPFRVELLTNMTQTQNDLRLVLRQAGKTATKWKQLPFSWPAGIYSLAHVALPFSPDDPIYGDFPMGEAGPVRLGNIHVRGEKKVFVIPERNMIRLRHNPFYAHMENRILQFTGAADDE
jgi:alpha-beta hydrolase superfamily lysophospholipase